MRKVSLILLLCVMVVMFALNVLAVDEASSVENNDRLVQIVDTSSTETEPIKATTSNDILETSSNSNVSPALIPQTNTAVPINSADNLAQIINVSSNVKTIFNAEVALAQNNIPSGKETLNKINKSIFGTNWLKFIGRIFLVLLIILFQTFVIATTKRYLVKYSEKITAYATAKFKPIKIKRYQILNVEQMKGGICFALKAIRYIIIALFILITIPLIFSVFPVTRNFILILLNDIWQPIKSISISFIKYIPDLVTIIIILFIAKYIFRLMKFFAREIEHERLIIKGFYPDWAKPTHVLLKFLLGAFIVVIIYPHLPGSDSAAFKGVSVLIGVTVSLGSSSAIGNIIAGLVLTYMRPFRIGDLIKVGDSLGFVVEKSTMVTRLRTTKNEFITFPNMMILSSSTIDYTKSIEDDGTLILYATVTVGYDIAWRKVHELLKEAALRTKEIEKTPEPFILQLSLDDFYAKYQLNAYTKNVAKIPAIYSELYQNIQDVFNEANINLTANHFKITRVVNDSNKML